MELVTLKTFENAIEAHLLRSRLANEGVTSFIFDENIMTLNPLYNIMVGGIKLKVPDVDFDRAQEILRDIEGTPFRDENNKVLDCPSCGSNNLYHNFKSFKGVAGAISAILTILLSVFPLYFNSVFRCKDCGHEFKMDKVAKIK